MRFTLAIVLALTCATPAHAFSCRKWLGRLWAGWTSRPDRTTDARDPYTTAAKVGVDGLRAFTALVDSDLPSRKLGAKLVEWADTPDRALYLYQHLAEFETPDLLAYLLKHSPQFTHARRAKDSDSLITYSFEKEADEKMTRFYRPTGYTDDEWLALDDASRAGILSPLLREKKFMPASIVAPTREKPAALGGLQQEVFGPLSFEAAHHSYELDPKRLFSQINEVTTKLGETDKLHVHVVFELPDDYPLEKFSAWVKDMNDAYQLEGMARGLFPSKLKGIPEIAPNPPKLFRWPFSVEKDLPSKLSEISWRRFKRFALGVRARMYGEASRPGYMKIGLELRDVSRDLPTLQGHVDRLSKMIQERAWEKRPDKWDGAEMPLTNKLDPKLLAGLKERGVRDEFAQKLVKLVPFLSLPLRPYEDATFFDYDHGVFRRPNDAQRARIRHAREVFWTNLYGLQGRADYFAGENKPWSDGWLEKETLTVLGYWAAYSNLTGLRN